MLNKMVLCPNGHLGYVMKETENTVSVEFDNKKELTIFNKNEVTIMNEFSKVIQDFFDDLWWKFKIYCVEKPHDFLRNIWWYFRNLHTFRKDLWNFRTWDFSYCKDIFATSLEELKENIRIYGHEVDDMRLKKVERLEELIYLITHDPEDNETLEREIMGDMNDFYFDGKTHTEAEKKVHHKRLLKYMRAVDKMEDERLERIFRIIKGQSLKELDTKEEIEQLKKEHPELAKQMERDGYHELFAKKFDGTGYKGWWD